MDHCGDQYSKSEENLNGQNEILNTGINKSKIKKDELFKTKKENLE
jgi:hypothetical protein